MQTVSTQYGTSAQTNHDRPERCRRDRTITIEMTWEYILGRYSVVPPGLITNLNPVSSFPNTAPALKFPLQKDAAPIPNALGDGKHRTGTGNPVKTRQCNML